jgi:hypothetical protein
MVLVPEHIFRHFRLLSLTLALGLSHSEHHDQGDK